MHAKPWCRRHFVAAMAAAPIAGCQESRAQADAGSARIPSLKLLARQKGLRFGAPCDVDINAQSFPFQRLYVDQCDLVAPNVAWQYTSHTPTAFVEPSNANVVFAQSHGLPLTGGEIYWSDRNPTWFAGMSQADQLAAMQRRAQQITERYNAFSLTWNVVNEQLDRQGQGENGFKPSPVSGMSSLEFVRHAFEYVAATKPRYLLAYNDIGLELDVPAHARKRDTLLKLVRSLREQGLPLSVVGLQTHLSVDTFRSFNQNVYADFLNNLAALGVRIIISELDVSDRGADADIGRRDAQVASAYSTILDAALANKAVGALLTWGLVDNTSWLNGADIVPGVLRADRLPQRPLPFDETLQPKPAFKAIVDSLNRAPPRPQLGS